MQPNNNAQNNGQEPNNVDHWVRRSTSVDDLDIPPDGDPLPNNVDHWVRRSTSIRRNVSRFDPSLHYIMLIDEGEPLTYKEAKACEHINKWELSMHEEIKALHANNTKGRKVIPNKWVYKIKIGHNKPKYKARLVAKGYA